MKQKLAGFYILILAIFFSFGEVKAATFCLVGQGISPQCLYEDVTSCSAASTTNTYCDVNPEARIMYYGSQRYCVVGSDRLAQCMYVDRNECSSQAGRARAICIERSQEQNDINPYRYDNRIQK